MPQHTSATSQSVTSKDCCTKDITNKARPDLASGTGIVEAIRLLSLPEAELTDAADGLANKLANNPPQDENQGT